MNVTWLPSSQTLSGFYDGVYVNIGDGPREPALEVNVDVRERQFQLTQSMALRLDMVVNQVGETDVLTAGADPRYQ